MRSIKTRITLFTLGIFVASIWALEWYTSRTLQADMQRLLGEQQLSVVSAVAKNVNDNLIYRMQALESIAKEVDADLMGRPAALQARLEQRPLLQLLFNGGAWFANVDGTAIADVPRSAQRIGVNYMDRDFITAALKDGKSTIGRPVMGKKLLAPVFPMTVPVRDAKGKVIGALIGGTNLGDPNFLDTITHSPYGKTGGYLLVEPQARQIITATDKNRIMEVLPAAGINRDEDRHIAGYEGYSVLVNARGEEQLASVKRVPVAGWYILLGTPTTEAFAPLHELQQRLRLAALFLTLLTGTLTWWILKRQLSPLVATAGAMAALAHSNQIPQPLRATSADEIGQLIDGFNRLLTIWTQREAALKESQQNLAITLNSIGDAVIATDAAGLITRMNPTAERLTGWPLADVLGRPLTEVFCTVNAHTRLPSVNPVQLVRERGEVVGLSNHTALLARDGHEYQIADSAAPIRDAANTIVGAVLVFSDVSEKYRVDEALRQAKSQLEIFFNHSPVAVAMFDRDMRYLHVSGRWLRDYGLGGRELHGLSHYDVFPEITDAWKAVHKRGLSGELVGADEDRFVRIDGTVQWLQWEVRPWHDPSGDVGGVLIFSEDITRRKDAEEALLRSEDLFRNTFRLMPASLTLQTTEGVLIDCSDDFCKATGFAREEVVGHNALELNLWADPQQRVALRQALQRDGLVDSLEFQLKRRDGKVTTMHMSARYMQIDDKPLVLSFAHDISKRKEAEVALRESETMLRNIVDGFGPNVFVGMLSTDGLVRMANQSALTAAGLELGDVLGQPVEETVWFRHSASAQQQLRQAVALAGQGIPSRFDVQIQGAGEQAFIWIDFSLQPVRDEAGRVAYLVPSALVIEDRKQAEVALLAAKNHLETTLNAIPDLLFEVDVGGRVLNYHAHRNDLLAAPPEVFLGKSFADVLPPAATEVCMTALRETAAKGWTTGAIYSLPLPQGETWFEMSGAAMPANGDIEAHFILVARDITERVTARTQIDTLAFYDPLTHLPNRHLLLDRLEQALHASTRHARKSALLFVDLDNFKTLNDTLGHHQGDLLLAQVAQRLKAGMRDGDTVARLGSDEFVVMLENLSEDNIEAATQAETVGDNVLKAFQQDFQLDQGSHHSTPSIGITLFGGDTLESSEQPLRRAELAMFQAKAAGRNTLRFFDAKMQAEVSTRAALEADLREAVHQQQFLLHYQPQVVGAGRVTGVEALVRWQQPLRGMVSPVEFIPLAEESGLILPIGQWVLETACTQLAAWASDPALAHISMAVNVSARQFRQPDFVESVLATLARTRASPKLLKLELTESMLVDDIDAIIAKMGALKARGVTFSLDDFGTGYSSLAYLKRLPLDQLKIDQGFVRNIVSDPNDAVIAKMVVVLAESMGLSVIAEGVELKAQADFLAHLGCHAYQGYFFSRPLTLDAFEAFARGR